VLVHPIAQAALGAVATAYVNQTIVKPSRVAHSARLYANQVRKPMITFVPTPGATVKSLLTRSLALGEVNLHPKARGASGRGRIGYGSPYRVNVPDRTFGSLFSYDTLEHLERPDLALLEWYRIADRVYVIAPPWWAPETWLNQWHISADLRRAWPVWAAQSRTFMLPTTGPGVYVARTCRTPRTMTATSPRPTPSPPLVRDGVSSNRSAPEPSPTPVQLPEITEEGNLMEDSPSVSPQEDSNLPYMPPIEDSPSSMFASSMMIVSGSDHESD
jgi:hypothetical protein